VVEGALFLPRGFRAGIGLTHRMPGTPDLIHEVSGNAAAAEVSMDRSVVVSVALQLPANVVNPPAVARLGDFAGALDQRQTRRHVS